VHPIDEFDALIASGVVARALANDPRNRFLMRTPPPK
jgi:hypothetical protein